MPNWAEGNLRIRGKNENIVEFLQEELVWCAYMPGLDVKEFPVIVDIDEYGSIEIQKPQELCDEGSKLGEPYLYIKDTRRNFVDLVDELWINPDNDTSTLFISGFRAAWSCHYEPYLEKALKHNVDIKIVVYERGMEFHQIIEIVGGKLIRDDCIEYSDFEWECEFPHMGG